MPDEQKSVEDIKSGIKKTLSQLPASDWTDNTGVYDYLKILNTSRELFDVLAEGILQALSKDPSVNPEVVNSIVEDRVANSRVADFKPANPDTTVSDKFGENKVVDTDFIYTLINRYNHVLDLLDNLGANGTLVKGIKSVKQNLTLLADKQDSMVDLDPILDSVNNAIDDIKKTVTDKTDAAQAEAGKALAAVTSDNISKTITDLISSGKIKVDDTLDAAVKQSFVSINDGASWKENNNDLSNVSRTVIDNSAFGVNLVTDAGTILKSYVPEKSYQNFVNIKRSDFIEDPIKIPNSGVNIDPGLNYTKRVQLWSGRVPATAGRDDSSIKNLNYSTTDSTVQGLQFLVVMEKRVMTGGNLSKDYTELPLVSSLSNEPQAGKYVCTVPIPVSIANESFSKASGTFEIPLSGIGEGLPGTKVALAPLLTISYTLQKSSISFVVNTTEGYALDAVSGKNNGAIYSPKIIFIRNYAVEKSSSTDLELPSGTVLWQGWQNSGHSNSGGSSGNGGMMHEVPMSKVNTGFSNVGSGIKVHFFAPYLLNSGGTFDWHEYDGSPALYDYYKGGSKATSSYSEPLERGTLPARSLLNLSKIDEYGNPVTDDWLIIPKDQLMNGYSISLLDERGFFPGLTKNPYDGGSYPIQFNIPMSRFNDTSGKMDPNSNPLMLSTADYLPSMKVTILDSTKLRIEGGLEVFEYYSGSYNYQKDETLLLSWYTKKKANQSAYIALFAIDKIVTYKV